MLMYGNGFYIPPEDKTIILNLASFREGFDTSLKHLLPPNEIGRLVGYDFDLVYANYLMEYQPAFLEMFNIVLHLYRGNDVYLLITDQDWTENLVESLFKFIQQRYGYNGIRINTFEDYIYFNSLTFSFNTDYGLLNFRMDRDRFTLGVEKMRISNGGKVHEFE